MKLRTLVTESPKHKREYKLLCALAFLPPNEIPVAFNNLEKSSEMTDFYAYFKRTYVERDLQRLPLYPPRLWSVYKALEEGLPRTTNCIESYHARLGIHANAKHVGLDSMINILKDETTNTLCIKGEIDAGGEWPVKPRKQFILRESRLTRVIERRKAKHFDNNSDYLGAIASNL